MTGARQWRTPCECRPDRHFSMHSQVSSRNLSYFISEERVPSEVDEAQLRRWYDRGQDTDRTLIACNQCRRVALVSDGEREVLAGPEPRGGSA